MSHRPEKELRKIKRPPDSARQAKQVIQRRTIYLLLLFGAATFLAVFAKAYDLTINQGEELKARASRQQTQSTPISASRGAIYDRSGTVLAVSATADTVYLAPRVIQRYAAELDRERAQALANSTEGVLPISGQAYKDLLAARMAELLELDQQDVYEKMERTWSRYEILKTRVDKATVGDRVRAFLTKDGNPTGRTIQGIYLQSDAKRYYPHSTLAAHVIGFLDNDNHGAYGLEAIYEDELDGKTGAAVTARDATGAEPLFQYEQYYDAEDGSSLQLTIDANIQSYLERGLASMVNQFGAANGAQGIVMDPRNGAILAIASNPTYDVNHPREIYDSALRDRVGTADGAGGTVNLGDMQFRQWRSKSVNDTYEPGSTYKILTLAMALEEGTVNPNSTFYCSGSIEVNKRRINCSRKTGHGSQKLEEAVGNSCNPAFINIGLGVGAEKYWEYLDAFGIFDKTGVDLQGEVCGNFHDHDTFLSADIYLATVSFGQTFTVTPIQLITAQAACINGGYLYKPHVVDQVLAPDGSVVKTFDTTPVRQVVSEKTSATVREMLEYVVAGGTGKNGQVAGYRVGGKTGTADKTGTGDVVVSFLCFAPADDPQVIMLLTMDTPSRNTGTYVSGGNMVAPTASAIMSDILPYLGIAPQYSGGDEAAADSTVPDVAGRTREDAAVQLKEHGFTSFRTVGGGETVTDQTPVGGAIVPASAEIILYMGEEKSSALCTVPGVVGLSAAEANRAMSDAGLIMKSAGPGGTEGIKALSQSIPAGEQIAAGTVVTVRMGQTSDTAD
ncbi:MAG: PASTA domain-containing protein [Oscillospiraceae bacterium]|nr:PASTA domain-containing protein [Oscillospiraceae bacterium]